MSAELKASIAELGAIVGDGHLRRATPADAIDGVEPQVVVEPGNADEAARVLSDANAAGLLVAPRGGGTKMDWGNAPRGIDVVVSSGRLNRVLEHAWGDMTATAEAGCTVGHFQKTLAEHGQHLALDPLWPGKATIGGILATNDSGAMRVRFGSLRDLIIGITIALPDGTIARSGGKVVKNVAGYDLPKLLTGSLGTLGFITEATFRLYPLAREARTLSFTSATIEAVNKFALAIHDSTVVPTGLQILARSGEATQVDVRFEGVAAALEAQTEQVLRLAAGLEQTDSAKETWSAHEKIWEGAEPALVCKLSVLPTQVGQLCDEIDRIASRSKGNWSLVVQSVGVGLLRLESTNEETLLAALEALRTELKTFGGSLVVLRCPREMKARIDVWGTESDALPLMRRVKERFDPAGILNPGRFVGGI